MSAYHLIGRHEEIEATATAIRGSLRLPPESLVTAREIIEQVSERGDRAVVEFIKKYDGAELTPGELEVSADQRREAWKKLDERIRRVLLEAAERIREFAARVLLEDWCVEIRPGVKAGQTYRAVRNAGIYIPGGRHPYPSTVLMTGIPASEAKVENIVFCIPPDESGHVNEVSLAATNLVGGSRVFKIGGAQAIAAMALGTETVPRCEFIAGPGNVYVTAAKRLLSHEVTVDLEAGPSEIAILVDGSCDISFAASDALAQLEHDPYAVAVVVSESEAVLKAIQGLISRMFEQTGYSGGDSVHYVECASRDVSIEFINVFAPEHLQLMVEEPASLIGRIRSAGCVFYGPYSPAVMGDYAAGPSHVLPTGGAARRLSGLSAQSFRRAMNIVSYDRGAFEKEAEIARVLSEVEGLEWHGRSIDIRLRSDSC